MQGKEGWEHGLGQPTHSGHPALPLGFHPQCEPTLLPLGAGPAGGFGLGRVWAGTGLGWQHTKPRPTLQQL